MNLLKLHSKTTLITYKNSICSFAFCSVLFLTTISVLVPIWLVSILSPYSAISVVQHYYEQPRVNFLYQYIIYISDEAEYNSSSILACSSFPSFNKLTKLFQRCPILKYWTEDYNHDNIIEAAHIELEFNNTLRFEERPVLRLFFFYEAILKTKCSLKLPAILINEYDIPQHDLSNGEIIIIGELDLIQNLEFICPYYGANIKSKFKTNILDEDVSSTIYNMENARKLIKKNSAYFIFKIDEFYFKKKLHSHNSFNIKIKLNINQVKTRYHLNIWERFSQFWLYFASFFGISFYLCNRIKDFLFSRHILNSWEEAPWKKYTSIK